MSDSDPMADVFDLDRLRQLVELMEAHGLAEVELKHRGQKVRVSRGGVTPVAHAAGHVAASAIPAPVPITPAAATSPHIVFVKSPMVGTFYSKPNPNAESYVKVGDHVDSATTVCIIEAMKVFNEIPAEVRGQIVAVLVEDGEPVEFNRPLFKVDTSL